MCEYFDGVARILVPDNCRTAVDHNKGWKNQRINAVYQEMTEHFSTAIIPARIRAPKDKPNVKGSIGNIFSTWITAALRNEQSFSLSELNRTIRQKLEEFSLRPFQKKEGSRYEIFRNEELPLLMPLPATPYELAEWKQATIQFNYHISFARMLYSFPYEYIKRKVDVRVTDKTIEIFITITGLHPTAAFMAARDNTPVIITPDTVIRCVPHTPLKRGTYSMLSLPTSTVLQIWR